MVVASRHGATAEIAAAPARDLGGCDDGRAAGLVAMAVPVAQQPDPAPSDAVLIGTAVYAGRWLEAAREYVATHAGILRSRQTWLF